MSLRHTVRIMRFLTSNELGFSIDGGETIESHYAHNIQQKQSIQRQTAVDIPKIPSIASPFISRLGTNNSIIISKAKILQQKMEMSSAKESYLVPPEGEPDEENDPEYVEEITEEIQKLAREAANRLAAKNKHGKIGFLRRNSNGTTGYNFLKNSSHVEENVDEEEELLEKPVTIGNLCEGLQPNSFTMTSFLDEKKNKTKPSKFLKVLNAS